MVSSLAVSARPRVAGVDVPLRAAAFTPGDLPAGLLHETARTARDVLDAERVSILVLDGDHLVPAASAARHDNPVRWSRFRATPPLPVAGLPQLRELLRAGRPVVVDDLPASGLVPPHWWSVFGLRSVAIAPLHCPPGPAGLLVVDHGEREHDYGENERARLGALARGAAAALRAARDQHVVRVRAATAQRVLELVAALEAASAPEAVLELAVGGALELLGGGSASVIRFEGAELVVLATDGPGQPEPGRRRLPRYGAAGVDELRALWRSDPAAPVVLDAAEAAPLVGTGARLPAYVLLPLAGPVTADGVIVVGVHDAAAVEPATLPAALRFAAAVAAALVKTRAEAALQRRLARADLLQRLGDELTVAPSLTRAIERISAALLAAGAEPVDAYVCDDDVARALRAATPQEPLAALVAAWRRRCVRRPADVGGLLVVPLVTDDGLLGVVRVRPLAGGADEAELVAIADGLAAVLARVLLRTGIVAAEREKAVEDERERLARDLHDTLGQALFGIALELDDCAGAAPDELKDRLVGLREAVAAANAEVRQAIHALSFLECGRDGLVPALRTLVARAGGGDGPSVDLRVTGVPVALPPAAEEAVYRVAHESLQNVRRHSGATAALVELAYGRERVSLTVCDDGHGIARDAAVQPGLHFGLRTMRRRMTEVGGGLEIRNASPRGVLVAAWVPIR